jgi:flagellar motor switch protein FliN
MSSDPAAPGPPAPPLDVSAAVQDYARLWAEATSRVLEQLHGSPFSSTPRPAAAGETSLAASGESLWIAAKISGRLSGQQCFQITRSDAVRMAQLLMSEPVDGAVPFNEGHADALAEIFRQFAGLAASACKSAFGGEVVFEISSAQVPEWKPSALPAWIFVAPQLAPLQWTLLVGPDLQSSLDAAAQPPAAPAAEPAAAPDAASASDLPAAAPESALEPQASDPATAAPPAADVAASAPPAASLPLVPPPPPAPPPGSRVVSSPHAAAVRPPAPAARPPAPAASAPAAPAAVVPFVSPANLDLLLDVELDASLRFGQREMLLRDILELRPGSVIELNRNIQEPAELLVGGRVIAHGEVVIVDGNYGLRITDIAKPQQRLESLET